MGDLFEFNEEERVILENTIMFMLKAHEGQKDKIGIPYYFHPIRVACKAKTCKEAIVGLLHDVLEDCEGYTLDDIRALVHDEEIVEAVDILTRREDETYTMYLTRIKNSHNSLAFVVKMDDIADNTDPDRVKYLPEDTKNYLMSKYTKAKEFLLCD